MGIETRSQSRGPGSGPGDEMLTCALLQFKQTQEAALHLFDTCSVFSKQPLPSPMPALVHTTKHTVRKDSDWLSTSLFWSCWSPVFAEAKRVGREEEKKLVIHHKLYSKTNARFFSYIVSNLNITLASPSLYWMNWNLHLSPLANVLCGPMWVVETGRSLLEGVNVKHIKSWYKHSYCKCRLMVESHCIYLDLVQCYRIIAF